MNLICYCLEITKKDEQDETYCVILRLECLASGQARQHKGEKKTMNITIIERSFACIDSEIQEFVVETGTFNILVG